MPRSFSLISEDVPRVNTKYRRITTPLPAPETIPILEKLRRYEPLAMSGQPPVVWDRAEDFQIFDKVGNIWLDFSSGVLVANAGHSDDNVKKSIIAQAEYGLLHNYCFPSRERAELEELLIQHSPPGFEKVFLLTTGSEAIENALKLARTYAMLCEGKDKIGIVGFSRSFHGRTLGAQQVGGMEHQKRWIANQDPDIVHVPFPDGYWNENTDFKLFVQTLEHNGFYPERVAAVFMETFLGAGPDFAPVEYVQALAAWCKAHSVLLILDEIQAGFGRTGKFWGFEHYGIAPDIICFGKGVTSSLPLSGVIGSAKVMDIYPPGSMSSTHTGNPVCVAAAIASIKTILDKKLVENAHDLEKVLYSYLSRLQLKYSHVIGTYACKGLVGGLQIVQPGVKAPNPDLAFEIVERCYKKGLLFFAPVGDCAQTIKISPPLTICEEALREGLDVLDEVISELIPRVYSS